MARGASELPIGGEWDPGARAATLRSIEGALVALGLGVMHARVYCELLKHGPLGATILARNAKISRGHIYGVLEELHTAGMIARHEDKVLQFSAYQPQLVLPALVDRREKELAQQRLALAHILPQGGLVTQAASESLVRDRLRILYNDEDIALFQSRLYRRARKSCLLFEKRTLFPLELPADVARREWYEQKTEAMGRCREARILVDDGIFASAVLRARLEAALRLGLPLRVSRLPLPIHALVVDRQHVLINLPERRDAPANPQVYMRHPGLAEMLAERFDELWHQASPSMERGTA